jgi:peptidoglycan-associated lipoprotein
MKRAGLIAATLAIVLVMVIACCPKKAPPQPPIAPPPQAEAVPPEPAPAPAPGAPEPVAPAKPAYTLQSVHFGFDQYEIRPEDVKIMDENAAYLRDNPNAKLSIEGYCDPVGTEEYNRGLGLRRANAAKNYLVKQGVDAARLMAISFGKDKLVTTDPKQFELNRRVEFSVK